MQVVPMPLMLYQLCPHGNSGSRHADEHQQPRPQLQIGRCFFQQCSRHMEARSRVAIYPGLQAKQQFSVPRAMQAYVWIPG